MRRITRVNCITLLAAASLSIATVCATRLDTQQQTSSPQAQQVDFEGSRGVVSHATSDAILDQLDGDQLDPDLLERHLAFEQVINSGPLVLGNKLMLLQNGPATYAAMFEAIRGATDSINLETFIFDGGEAGQQFSDLLLERQAAGVQVNVIRDSIGSLTTPAAFFDRLGDSGIALLEFNPVNPLAGKKREWLLNNRDHRRQLIVDGRIAFTGGVNISDTYRSAPLRKRSSEDSDEKNDISTGWRDTHIRVEGPVVAEFQQLFMDTWARQRGNELAPRDYFPELVSQGQEIVRVVASTPDDPENLIYLTLMSAIDNAERSVHLTVAYFAPGPELIEALIGAARRGVDVELVMPRYTDSWAIFNLGRSHYMQLLKGGVKLYERGGGVMHAKTACIDGVWSTIGSSNLDMRSLLHNDELNAVILGREFAEQMEIMFTEDIAQSEEIKLDTWRRRPLSSRIKEQLARLGAYWL